MHRNLLVGTFILAVCSLGIMACSDEEMQNIQISDCVISAIINGNEWCSNAAAAVKSAGNDGNQLVSIGAQSNGETLSLAYRNNEEGEHPLNSGAFVDARNIVYNFVEGKVDIGNVSSRDLTGSFSLTVSNPAADPQTIVITGSFNRLPFE